MGFVILPWHAAQKILPFLFFEESMTMPELEMPMPRPIRELEMPKVERPAAEQP